MKKLFLFLFLIIPVSLSMASPPKIGHMNPQTVLDRLPEKIVIEDELNRFLDEREASFEAIAIEFQNKLAEFQQQAQHLSEAEIRRKQQELQVMDQELEQYQFEVQRELEQRQSELLRPIIQKMNDIIEKIAKEKNLTYVLNTATSEGEQMIMFISDEYKEKYDLTERVLSQMIN